MTKTLTLPEHFICTNQLVFKDHLQQLEDQQETKERTSEDEENEENERPEKRPRLDDQPFEFTKQGEWVAVFYNEAYYIGQVLDILSRQQGSIMFIERRYSQLATNKCLSGHEAMIFKKLPQTYSSTGL